MKFNVKTSPFLWDEDDDDRRGRKQNQKPTQKKSDGGLDIQKANKHSYRAAAVRLNSIMTQFYYMFVLLL